MEHHNSASDYTRINIYLNNHDLKTQIKLAAARRGISISAYCEEAIRNRLTDEGLVGNTELGSPQPRQIGSAKEASRALDRLRRKVGPIGVPVRELIDEGRS